jgi:hypothetical protein
MRPVTSDDAVQLPTPREINRVVVDAKCANILWRRFAFIRVCRDEVSY